VCAAVFKLRWNQGIEINDMASHICQKVAFSVKEEALYKGVLKAYKQHTKQSTKCSAVHYCSEACHKRTFWLKFFICPELCAFTLRSLSGRAPTSGGAFWCNEPNSLDEKVDATLFTTKKVYIFFLIEHHSIILCIISAVLNVLREEGDETSLHL